MRRWTILLISLVALPCLGQTPEKRIDVSPFGGYLFGGAIYDYFLNPGPDQPTINVRADLADHSFFGLLVGFRASRHWEPEIEWSHSSTSIRIQGLLGIPDLSTNLDYFLGGLSYEFGADRLRPYLTLLAGAARIDTAPAASSNTRFASSFGGGLKVFLTPSLGVRLEGRLYASRLAGADLGQKCTTFLSPTISVFGTCPAKSWLVNGATSGGLVLAF